MIAPRTILTTMFGILFLFASQAIGQEIEPGLYLRTTYAFGNLSLSTVLIGPDHKIAMDPKNGVDPFDFDAAAKDSSQKVGTFKIDGAKAEVAWSGGKTEKLDVEFDKGKFSALDGGLISKADAYKKDQTLDAQYAGSGQTANVSSSVTIVFTAGGDYTMTRLGGIRAIPGATGIAEKTEKGTYKLSGNTLTMTGADGKVAKHTVLPMNTALDPAKAKINDDHMIFDGANFKREK